MTARLEASIQRWRGNSSDEKPRAGVLVLGESALEIRQGSEFIEEDTGQRYRWDGFNWILQEQTIEALFLALMNINQDMLAALQVIQGAVATLANNAWETQYPTGC